MAAEPAPMRRDEYFDTLLRSHAARVYALVHRLVGAAEAADIVQEVWLAIYRALPGFRAESKVTTWMFTIAARVCEKQRWRRRLELVDAEVADTLPTADGEPDVDLLRAELAQHVREAIDQLPPGQREAVHLRYLEDCSYDEIATILNIPVGTVRSRLHNGLARLADVLQPYLETTDERG